MASLVAGLRAETVKMRDAATHEQLSAALQKPGQRDPMVTLKPSVGIDPASVNRPKDILSDSDILCFGAYATLVPKRAILQIPKNFADRMGLQPRARIQNWADFFAANRGWITTVEVSRTQAQGKEPIADETRKQMVKSGNLIVATYKGGPISVLPPVVPVVAAPPATPVKQP